MASSTIRRHPNLRALALAGTSTLAAMLSSGTASADELTWDGSSGSDWTNPANWNPESVPTAADEVVVPAGPTGAAVDPGPIIDNVAAEAKGVEIFGRNTLTVRNNAVLTVDGGSGAIDLSAGGVGLFTFPVGNLVIGGNSATAPGTIDAAGIRVEPLTNMSGGTVTFSHNSADGSYHFGPSISGPASVLIEDGWTVLTGANSYTRGTEIKALATLQGNSDSLTGAIAGEAFTFGSNILASTLIITGDGDAPLQITAAGGKTHLVNGMFDFAGGSIVTADRLVITDAFVNVGAGATLGTGATSFVTGSTFADGGVPVTQLIDATVNFAAGSEVEFLGAWQMAGASTLIFDNGPGFGPVIRSLSGGPDSTLDVRAGTTLNIFNHRNSGTFAGTLHGAADSTIEKSGAGDFTLRPQFDSTYSGTVHVRGGTLNYERIASPDFEQINLVASLLMEEDTFAHVFGVVRSLESEGTLEVCGDRAANGEGPAGACGASTGPLTVMGDMTLGPTSHLRVTLGEPTGPAIVTVGGDLTIDGLFDFDVGSSHSCDGGLYRIIAYDGHLTDNGAEIGESPGCFSGIDLSLQTSTPGQVNLLAGSTGGGGGDGDPDLATWLFEQDRAAWDSGLFDVGTQVIFQGPGREIAVEGPVELGSGGIQFFDDGFVLDGGPDSTGGAFILLGPDFTPIRVGDGTAAGAAITGSVAADIDGDGGLLKSDLGTLVLAGTSTYAGGTQVVGGVLVGTTDSLQGVIDIAAGATARIDQDFDGTFNGTPMGAGTFGKSGSGTVTVPLEGESTFVGTVEVNEGRLVISVGPDFKDNPLDVAALFLVDDGAFADVFGGGAAAFGGATLGTGSGLAVGPDTTLIVGGLDGAPGSLIFVDEGSLLDLDGDCSHAGDLAGAGTVILGCSLLDSDFSDFDGEWEIPAGHEAEFFVSSHTSALKRRGRGEGTLVKSGIATFELLDGLDPDFAGDVRVENGTLLIHGEDLPAVFEVEIFPFATLGLNQTADQAATLSGTMRGGGEIAKTGDGMVTLETNSGWSRVLTLAVAEGTVQVETEEPGVTSGFAAVTIASGAMLTVAPGTTVEAGSVVGAAGSRVSVATGGTLGIGGESTIDQLDGGGVLQVGGPLTLNGDAPEFTGTIALTIEYPLSLHVAGDGTFSGTFVGEGNVIVDADGRLRATTGFGTTFGGTVVVNTGSLVTPTAVMGGLWTVREDGILVFDPINGAASSGDSEYLGGYVDGNGTLAMEGEGALAIQSSHVLSDDLQLEVRRGEVSIEADEPGAVTAFDRVMIASGAALSLEEDTTVVVRGLDGAAGSLIFLDDGSVLDLDGDCSHAGEIAGGGTLAVRCDLTLDGDSPDFAGHVDVAEGGNVRLNAVFGSTADLDDHPGITTHVNHAGHLSGFGKWFADILVESGGTIAPGNSIGTLTVGEVTFEAGSIFEVEVDDAGNSDLLAVTGAATLGGGTVRVLAENGTDNGSSYAPETEYTILTAGDGVTGTFDQVTEDFAFLSAALSYGTNAVTLVLTRDGLADFCLGGATVNQCATGEGVESLGSGPLFAAVLVLSEPDALDAFDALSGEIHASARTALLEDSRFPREAALARMRGAFGAIGGSRDIAERSVSDRFSFWGQAVGAWGDWDGDGNVARLDRSIGGLTMGGDALVGDAVRVGLFGSYSDASFDVDSRASSGSAESVHLGAYGGGQWNGFSLRVGAAYGWHDLDTSRSVAFNGFSDSLSAGYDARTLQGFAEAGFRIEVGEAAFEPFGSLAHVSVRSGGFSEAGGAAALAGPRRTDEATFTTLGVRAETAVGLGEANVRLSGMVGWRHAFGHAPVVVHEFAAGSSSFAVAGAPLAEDLVAIEAGLGMVLAPAVTFGVGYSGQFGSGVSDHGMKAHLAVRF